MGDYRFTGSRYRTQFAYRPYLSVPCSNVRYSAFESFGFARGIA